MPGHRGADEKASEHVSPDYRVIRKQLVLLAATLFFFVFFFKNTES